MKLSELIKTIDTLYTKKGFLRLEPLGLLDKKTVDFNSSAGHEVVDTIVSNKPLDRANFLVFERCFRKQDMRQVGWSHHTSFFEMANAPYVGSRSLNDRMRIVQTFLELTDVLEIPRNKLLVTIHNGGNVENLEIPADKEGLSIWKEVGLGSNQIVPISGRRNFVYSREHGSPGGISSEIYYDRGETFSKPTRFLEIASLNVYGYGVDNSDPRKKHKLILFPTEKVAYATAMGLERMVAVMEDAKTIYETSHMKPLVDIFTNSDKNFTTSAEIYSKDINRLVDALRSIYFLLMDGYEKTEPKSPRDEIFSELLMEVKGLARFMDYDSHEIYEDFVEIITELYKDRFENVAQPKQKFLSLLKKSRVI